MESYQAKKNLTQALIHLFLIVFSITMLVPFLWMVLTAFKTQAESTSIDPFVFLPTTWSFESFTTVWTSYNFLYLYRNTLLMILFRVIGSVFFSATAAYAFARIEFPGRNVLFGLVLVTMMIPGQLFLIPQYEIVARLGAVDSLFALVLPGIVSAFGTFLLRQFFLGIPKELEEAAVLDGCSRWQIFWHVMLPLTRSGLIALSIFTALFAWKDLMWPLIVNTSLDKMPLASGLASLQGQYSTNFPQLMAGSMIAIWPMLILFVLFQKQFIQGVAGTGSKN